MKKIISFSLSCILLFTGCTNDTEYSIKEPSNRVISSLHNTYKNGIVYTDGNILNFIEYTSFNNIPLCNKPNCLHNDSSCIAKVAKTQGSTPSVVYKDKIYYFTSSSEITESKDEKSTNYSIKCDLNKIDLHTGTNEKVCTFSDMEAITSSQIVLENNKIYFIANNGSIQNPSGAWYYFSSGGRQNLCSVNLDTGEFHDYGQINDNKKMATTLFSIGEAVFGINGQISIDGFFNDLIYMHYYYADSAEIVYNNLECSVYDENSIFHRENVTFDINSNQFSTDSNFDISCTNDKYCIYWDNNLNKYISKTHNDKIEMDMIQKCDGIEIYDDTIWCIKDSNYVSFYNLDKKQLFQIAEKYKEKNMQIIDKQNNQYIIHYYDEKIGQNVFERIPESDLCGS